MGRRLDFYSSLFANWLAKGAFVTRSAMSSLGIKPLYDKIMTRTWLKQIVVIDEFGIDFDYVLSQLLQDNVSAADSNSSSDKKNITGDRRMKVITNFYCSPVSINIKDTRYLRHLSDAWNKYDRYNSACERLNDSDKLVGKMFRFAGGGYLVLNEAIRKKLKSVYESYMYVTKRVQEKKHFMNTGCYIEVMGRDLDDLKDCLDVVESTLDGLDIKHHTLRGKSSRYLDNLCPASFEKNDKLDTNVLLSDENLSILTPYMTKGFVGDGKGILMGIDQGSKYPFLLNFFCGGGAQVVALCAKTGAGKTIEAFQMVLSFLGEGHHVSVVDVKGGEWNRLGQFTEMIEIGIGDKNPKFVNILRLDDLIFDDVEDAKYMYRTAIDGVVGLVKILVSLSDKDPYNETDLENLVNQAVTKVFYSAGVDVENPQTFKYTKTLKYKDVLDVLNDFESANSFSENKIKLIKVIIDRCSDFFKGEGRYKGILDNEITVMDIMDYPLVIYSLNKNGVSGTSLFDSIQTFMISFLDLKKQYLRKKQKLFTAALYEELQRKYEFKELLNFICSRATGARSSNLVMLFLFNTLSIFKDKDIDHIKSSITTYVIGKLNKSDRDILKEHMDCSLIYDDIEEISSEENAISHRNFFAVQYDNGVDIDNLIVKAYFPNSILDKLKTRDTKED